MKSRQQIRAVLGQSALEMVGGLVLLVPIVLSGMDLTVLLYGGWMNNEAARNGARIAASGPPKGMDEYGPLLRAKRVIQKIKGKGPIRITRVQIRESIQRYPDATYGGPVIGTVTATTTATVAPPFIIKNFIPNGYMTLKSEATFPYTWVKTADYMPVPTPSADEYFSP